ncbi:MAG: DUF5658 family protein [Methanomicrobiales archaeon]|nr:DUF5658 family protein [Methanomicrobiales archaeon]
MRMRFQHHEISILLILLFASLSWIDIITTSIGIRNGFQELNPYLAPYVQDPALFLLIKFVGLSLIIMFAILSRWINPRGDHVLLVTVCGINLIPAFWNLSVLSPLFLMW